MSTTTRRKHAITYKLINRLIYTFALLRLNWQNLIHYTGVQSTNFVLIQMANQKLLTFFLHLFETFHFFIIIIFMIHFE